MDNVLSGRQTAIERLKSLYANDGISINDNADLFDRWEIREGVSQDILFETDDFSRLCGVMVNVHRSDIGFMVYGYNDESVCTYEVSGEYEDHSDEEGECVAQNI